MTRIEEYQAYCQKTGLPDCMAGFALYNAWQSAESKLRESISYISDARKVNPTIDMDIIALHSND
jgi:hypothetical protein